MFSVNYVLPQGILEYDQTYQGPGSAELTTSIDKRNIRYFWKKSLSHDIKRVSTR